MFNHRYRYLFMFLLAAGTYACTELCQVYYYFRIDIEWYAAFITILTVTVAVWECNRVMERYVLPKLPPTSIRKLVSLFLLGNVIVVVACLGIVYLIGNALHGFDWKQNFNPLKLNIIYGCLINLLFHLLNTILLFFREYQRQWMEAEELRRATIQAEMQLVKSQINPHFLFNNLNVLSAMVLKENPTANKFIEEFATVYRYVLNNQDKEVVPLDAELEFINSYIFLLQKRFSDGLSVSLDIPEHYRSWYIVPAALQMLIENAIKHNVVSTARPLSIQIRANGKGTITVANNLQKRKSLERSTNIGLNNIDKRYQLIIGKRIGISHSEHLFEVTLPLLQLN